MKQNIFIAIIQNHDGKDSAPYISFTVYSEIFAMVLFLRDGSISFVKINSLNGVIALLFTDAGKSCPSLVFLSFNAIRENKILAKLSEFTILYLTQVHKVHSFFKTIPSFENGTDSDQLPLVS